MQTTTLNGYGSGLAHTYRGQANQWALCGGPRASRSVAILDLIRATCY